MGGWKVWAAALGLAATGLGMVISGLLAEVIDAEKIKEGVLMIIAAVGMIGIGHKIEKVKQ